MFSAPVVAPGGDFEAKGRLEAELGYGVGLKRNAGLLTPYASLSLGSGARTYRAGTRWNLAPDTTLGLEATREERGEENLANAVLMRAAIRW